MKDFKTMPKMACGGGVKKYGVGGAIAKAANKAASSQLAPAALFAPPAGLAVYSDMKAQDRAAAAKQAAEEKEENTKKEPEAKKKGGTVRRNKK